MLKKIIIFCLAFFLLIITGAFFAYRSIKTSLPQLITVKDYEPLLVSYVYDRNNKKIGEFFRERRTLVPYDKIPKHVVNAFLAAEDDQFFQHGGINYSAILRSTLANLRAGKTVQGGSTITQQVAKTLLLSPERTFLRKFREALLAIQMEENLSKEEILYLYLNQIYFGQGAYGVENAAQTYFRKPISQVSVKEAALLAGLPKAPSRYSPVSNPQRAKERQVYVLHRMSEVGFITPNEYKTSAAEPIKVFVRENFTDFAPFYLETVRQILVQQLGEEMVLDKGLRIYTSLDLDKQKSAQVAVEKGLKELDKRQGFRGALKNFDSADDYEAYLNNVRKQLIEEYTPERTITADGNFAEILLLKNNKKSSVAPKDAMKLPPYLKVEQNVEGIVEAVDDTLGLVFVKLPEAVGLIDFDSMKWARKPDSNKRFDLDQIEKPSQALKAGDVILTKITNDKFITPRRLLVQKKKGEAPPKLPDFANYVTLELDQEPVAEAGLLSFDQNSQDILAMVGGYSYARNQYNRTIQAARQTGSAFKTIVYASALDKGYTPSTPIMDAPIVYEEANEEEGQEDTKTWKPSNHGKTYGGEIILRNALVKSLNVPTVKIIEDIGVPWAADYARRLGVFSPLNMDFTLALGSSSVTLYEMTKVFSVFGRMGKNSHPQLVHKVLDRNGKVLVEKLSLDMRFDKEISPIQDEYTQRRTAYFEELQQNPDQTAQDTKKQKPDKYFFFENPEQLIKPQTAYVMTTLLKGVVEDRYGTGGRAKALGREVAAKTGSTSGYYDAWFIGFTAQMSTGVWVGFDKEKSLGKGEVGGRAALPIWLDYMKAAHEGLPQMTLPVPEGIVFANIDSETGKLASASSKNILRQAFVEGTEPTASDNKADEATEFYKEDLSE